MVSINKFFKLIFLSCVLFRSVNSMIEMSTEDYIPRKISALRLNGPVSIISWLEFSPNGKELTSYSLDNKIRLWNLETGECAPPMTPKNIPCSTPTAFSPNGKWIAAASDDGIITLFETSNGITKFEIHKHRNRITAMAFSPDSKWLATGSWDCTVRLWDVEAGRYLSKYEHSEIVTSLAFSHDGKLLASGACDAKVILWSMEKQECIHQFPANKQMVYSVAFSHDGTRIAAGLFDGSIVIFTDKIALNSMQGRSGLIIAPWTEVFKQ